MHSKLGNKAFLVDFVDDKFKYFLGSFIVMKMTKDLREL